MICMKNGSKVTNLERILFIDVDNLKFSESSEQLGIVIEKVNAELHGLF